MMATPKFEYFFDLPTELREQILGHICLFPGGVLLSGGSVVAAAAAAATTTTSPVSNGGSSSRFNTLGVGRFHEPGVDGEDGDEDDEDEEDSAGPPVNLFLASPVLYREAAGLYYGGNVFHFDLGTPFGYRRRQRRDRFGLGGGGGGGGGGGDGEDDDGGAGTGLYRLLVSPGASGARRRIRSVVAYVRRLGGVVMGGLVPALREMVMGGGLKRVRVDVRLARASNADLSGSRVLRALLVVLTDPDVQRAELRVPRGTHSPFWCRFHQGGGDGGDDGDGRGGCAIMSRSAGRDGEEEFVEVDIHQLVQACAGDAAEFRIKKVGAD